jgi:hypothetical protein
MIIADSAVLERVAFGRRLLDVALRRLRVAVRGGVLATISRLAAPARPIIGQRLNPITLGRGRVPQLSRALPIHRGMTTVPAALIEL